MKWVGLRALCMAVGLVVLFAAGACAQSVVQVYVSEDAMPLQEAQRLMALLDGAFEQAEFELVFGGTGTLRERVLSDRVPGMAICAPQEARPWAREGLLLPLQRRIDDQERIARTVLYACVQEENLFMAPLFARRRQMAVNAGMLEKRGLGYMLDEIAHPVWYPTEFQQILEEFAIADMPALDVWKASGEDSAALEAVIQAIYSGSLLDGNAQTCLADSAQIRAGVRWMRDLVQSGMVGRCETRQEAIDRFAAGETAILLDWTEQLQDAYAKSLEEHGVRLCVRPYPSSSGLPVRSYEIVGVSVFDGDDAAANALAIQAAVFLHESKEAQRLLGERGIFEDDSIWLWDLASVSGGATLRSLFGRALDQVLAGERDTDEALALVSAAMKTAE